MKKRHLFPAPKQAPSRYARGVSKVSNRPAQCAEAAAYPAIPHCAPFRNRREHPRPLGTPRYLDSALYVGIAFCCTNWVLLLP